MSCIFTSVNFMSGYLCPASMSKFVPHLHVHHFQRPSVLLLRPSERPAMMV